MTAELLLRREWTIGEIRRAEETFRLAKREYLHQAEVAAKYVNALPPPWEAPEVLRRLQSAVEKYRSQLAEIDALLSETPESRDAVDGDVERKMLLQSVKDIEI